MSMLIAELTATCNALGYAVKNNKYLLDKECKEAIRELIRFLRRDDETHEVRRHLGVARIVQTDLVPILIHHHNDEEMLDLLLRLLVNLTTPALLLYNEKLPTDKVSRQHYLSLVKYLQEYKYSFSKPQLWTVLYEKLSKLLKMDWSERGEERSLILVRILILVRNVLNVPCDVDTEKRPDNDANTHDQVIWALHEGGMINLIMYIATSENEQQYYFHVLEIVSLMLRDQKPEVLASASVQRSIEEKQRDVNELMAVRRKESEARQEKIRKLTAARHPKFGGTFIVRGVKSISDNDLIVHSLDNQISSAFDRRKNKLKTPKNRMPMQSDNSERRSAFSVRVIMKEFCIEFLNGAYNSLMHYIREMFHRGKAQNNDESFYFWAMRFFMEFNRHYRFEVKLISETMHVSIFHFTQERIEEFRAKLIVDKEKVHLWSKRMHLGLNAYKELLNTLMKMYQSSDVAVKESAHTIMSNIFYVVEYRELLMGLLNLYDEIKFSKLYLQDLTESNHIFMKMLEHFCKRHRTLVVQKKAKFHNRKKKMKKSEKQTTFSMEPNDEKWNEIEPRITDIFVNDTELDVQSMPFDAASDTPFEEQKVEAMRRIRLLLMKAEVEEAIGLFRASREVWPENNCFGSANMSTEEECSSLKEIFFADIGFPTVVNNEYNSESEEEDVSENEEDAQVVNVSDREQSFQFMDFVKKFAKPKIVYACCLLLAQFEKNSTYTNHCVLKLLHRIAFDCKYAAILFQASVFRTFQRILSSTEEQHKDLKKFAEFIIRKFVDVAQRNKKVYMELLFWKGNKEAYEIEEGYGSLSSNSGKVAWTEEQEDELQRLFAEYERDKPDQDLVDWIHANLIDQSRSRRGLIQKMRELNLLEGPKNRAMMSSKPPKEFSESEIAQITELFNEFKEAYDVVGCIIERLDVKRPKKRIIDKILELGLVQDRKELRKKKKKKSSNNVYDGSAESQDEILDSDSDSDEESRQSSTSTSEKVSHVLSLTEITRYVKAVVDDGLKEAIDWITSSVLDVIEDIGDDESDVPILPLTECAQKAIDNSLFQNLLLTLGLKRPADTQEVYWRIPGLWDANELRKRISLIETALKHDSNMDTILDGSINENYININEADSLGSEKDDADELRTNRMSIASYSECPDSINLVEEASKYFIKSKKKRFNAEEFKRQINSSKRKRIKMISDRSDSDGDRSDYQNSILMSRSDSECDRGTTDSISKLNYSNSNDANREMENRKDELNRTKRIQKNNNLSNRSKKALESEGSQSDAESDQGIVLKSSKSSVKHVLSSDDSSEENNGSRMMRKRPALQSSSSDEDEKAELRKTTDS